MNKLSITKRAGQIGGSIVNRTQMHGKKEKVPAVSIPVSGIILTEEEFGAIMQDSRAFEAFFTDERSQVLEPRFPGMDPISISDKFEGARATIKIEDGDEPLVLKPATIGGIVITPMGGQAIFKCMVSGVPDVHLQTLTLLNKRCTISILNGALADRDEKQKDLPLAGGGPNVEPKDDGDENAYDTTLADATREEEEATRLALGEEPDTESRISRQIRKSEGKKKRASKKK
jgi:hypothetical protein